MVKTCPASNCPVCNQSGYALYTGLSDKLYAAPGTWSVSKCGNKKCQTLWLNPAPAHEDTGLLYQTYSTHHDPQPKPQNRHRLMDKIRQAVLNYSLGYPSNNSAWGNFCFNLISYLHPAWRDTQAANTFYIPYQVRGKLLDIGCGSGSSMMVLKNLGWQVTGIDFDQAAIDNAQSKGLDAHVGGIDEQSFEPSSFDAILMNHVIEHIHEPVELLTKCHRLLKPNGVLVAMTPNSLSRGHRRFLKNWRGLEIPRHIQVFSPNSLETLALKAGFKNATGGTSSQGILYIYDASLAMETTGSFDVIARNAVVNHLRWFGYGLIMCLKLQREEVAVLRCQK